MADLELLERELVGGDLELREEIKKVFATLRQELNSREHTETP